MGECRVEGEIAASPSAVWDVVRDFGGVKRWSPDIASCELEGHGIGAVRTIKMGSMMIRERLEKLDENARTLSYSIVEGPIPVQDYLATMKLSESSPGHTKLTWSSTFKPGVGLDESQLRDIFAGVYQQGIEGIRRAVGLQH